VLLDLSLLKSSVVSPTRLTPLESPTQKSALLAAIQQEIHRHDFSHFVDEPPSVAEGGKGVVVSGCPACKKRINSMSQFLDHLANDAMPPLLDRLSSEG
jgi:hypothetical protein